uniref:Pentatricopeptide repeat-containing protein n=1 Tax=Chenopodium quinoa TaxID=63459 RepID=A0A803L482_CHEQI
MRRLMGCKPDIGIYHMVMYGFCKDNLLPQASKLFSEMISDGVLPTVTTLYNLLIWEHGKLGQWDELWRLLREMIDAGISPNTSLYNILIGRLSKEGRMKEMERVSDMMIDSCHVPDTVTYSSLIDGYCKNGLIDKAR